MSPINVLVKGWLNIYHSYAIVNYFQLKYLLKNPNLKIFYQPTPYYNLGWKNTYKSDLPLDYYCGQPIDIIYTISFPYVIEDTKVPQILFYTNETGRFEPTHFNKSLEEIRNLVNEGTLILVTPSEKSARSFTSLNIPVSVIPHGVCPKVYNTKVSRKINFNFPENSKVILNVSAMSGNKNLQLIVESLLELPDNYCLVIKGNKDLYGAVESLQSTLQCVRSQEQLNRIRFIPDSLTFTEMKQLYQSADVYVSAGFYEAFDMPIAEAIACGTPTITHKHSPSSHLASATFSNKLELKEAIQKELTINVYPLSYQEISNCLYDLIIKTIRNL